MTELDRDNPACVFDLMQAHLGPLVIESGGGHVEPNETALRFTLKATDGRLYSNAQVDDYHDTSSGQSRWRPPLCLQVRARFSHGADALSGTAGFGFWNDPFGMTGLSRLRLPRAIWFFYSAPPSDMALAQRVPGHGWKAATLDVLSWEAAAVIPAAPLLMAMFQMPGLKARLWPRVQRRLRIAEALAPADMHQWHEYEIEWRIDRCCFRVDGACVLTAPFSPGGPLGLIVWIDNQYMIATPQGRFRHGLVSTDTQWMEIASLVVRSGVVTAASG